MSMQDFQLYKRYLGPQIAHQFPNTRDRNQEISRLWRALGSRNNKVAEVQRLRAAAGDRAATDTTMEELSDDDSFQGEAANPQRNARSPASGYDPLTGEYNGIKLAFLDQDDSTVYRINPNQRVTKGVYPRCDILNLRRKIRFIDARMGLSDEWVGAGSVASGHANYVALWAYIDRNGMVSDRMVIKDTFQGAESWTSPWAWSGDARTLNRVPFECNVLQRLEGSNNNVVPFPTLRMKYVAMSYHQRMYRLYFTFMPYPDAHSVLNSYCVAGAPIPEPWVWNVFEGLAKAALIMEQGAIDRAVPGWKTIVHRDLKPANIFFDTPDPNLYPAYPSPKVGDFGLAFETSPDDPLNPFGYKSDRGALGTNGYKPPEHFTWVNPITQERGDDFKILGPSNVWGVGAIIASLINQDNPPTIKDVYPGAWLRADRATAYSVRLQSLVGQCLRYSPDDRLTASSLLNAIHLSTGAVDPRDYPEAATDYAQGYRSDINMPAQLTRPMDIYQPAMYLNFGMTREQVEGRRRQELADLQRQLQTLQMTH